MMISFRNSSEINLFCILIYNKLMSYSNGTAYYTKSMNGVITYDDGQGPVIENGTITTTNN